MNRFFKGLSFQRAAAPRMHRFYPSGKHHLIALCCLQPGCAAQQYFFRHGSAIPRDGKTQCHYENLVHIESDLQRRTFGKQSSIERAAECHLGEFSDWQACLDGSELVGSIWWKSHAPSGRVCFHAISTGVNRGIPAVRLSLKLRLRVRRLHLRDAGEGSQSIPQSA